MKLVYVGEQEDEEERRRESTYIGQPRLVLEITIKRRKSKRERTEEPHGKQGDSLKRNLKGILARPS